MNAPQLLSHIQSAISLEFVVLSFQLFVTPLARSCSFGYRFCVFR